MISGQIGHCPPRFWQNSNAKRQRRRTALLLPHPALATPLIDYAFFTISGQYLTKLSIVQRDAATMDAALIIIIVHHMFAQ